MIERIDGDVAQLANFFSRFVLQVLASVLLLLGAIVVLILMDWRLGLTLAVFALAALALLVRIRMLALPAAIADRATSAALFGHLEEWLAGTEDIRARGATQYVLHGLMAKMRDRLRARRRAAAMTSLSFGATNLTFAMGTALAYVVGGTLYRSGAVTLGTVYLVVTYSWLVTQPLALLSQQFQDVQEAGASLGRIQTLLNTESVIRDSAATMPLPQDPLQVDVEHVSFSYVPDVPVLHDASFTVRPGRVLGLLGHTGSGKTTITRLLLRLYDPTHGALRLGGVDLRSTRQAQLRARVRLVTQEVQLFQGTVRDNLTFFDSAIPDARILDALHALGLGPWYQALPAGLDTAVASGGSGFSAGEAQVLAFTRVFLKDPSLLILDEASSRLDPATERRIDRAVEALLRGRSGIIVAHRLASVQRADDILILDQGRIVEYGERAALARDANSRFSHLHAVGLEVWA
jgi:ABC-type multidrug transport system fused ATPase/permease subunit